MPAWTAEEEANFARWKKESNPSAEEMAMYEMMGFNDASTSQQRCRDGMTSMQRKAYDRGFSRGC